MSVARTDRRVGGVSSTRAPIGHVADSPSALRLRGPNSMIGRTSIEPNFADGNLRRNLMASFRSLASMR